MITRKHIEDDIYGKLKVEKKYGGNGLKSAQSQKQNVAKSRSISCIGLLFSSAHFSLEKALSRGPLRFDIKQVFETDHVNTILSF